MIKNPTARRLVAQEIAAGAYTATTVTIRTGNKTDASIVDADEFDINRVVQDEREDDGSTTTVKTFDMKPEVVAQELRDSINSSMVNVGVLAALMLALAGAIYTDPAPIPGKCVGESIQLAEMVIVWMAMGMFFFETIGAMVLYMDVEGVPTNMMLLHLSSKVQMGFYCLPHLATALGIFLTATAYGIDIGERGGCPFLIFGLIAAPMFVFAIYLLWKFGRDRRKKLIKRYCAINNIHFDEKEASRTVSLFATWSDRVDLAQFNKEPVPA